MQLFCNLQRLSLCQVCGQSDYLTTFFTLRCIKNLSPYLLEISVSNKVRAKLSRWNNPSVILGRSKKIKAGEIKIYHGECILINCVDASFYQAKKIKASALQYIIEENNSNQYKCLLQRRSILHELPSQQLGVGSGDLQTVVAKASQFTNPHHYSFQVSIAQWQGLGSVKERVQKQENSPLQVTYLFYQKIQQEYLLLML